MRAIQLKRMKGGNSGELRGDRFGPLGLWIVQQMRGLVVDIKRHVIEVFKILWLPADRNKT